MRGCKMLPKLTIKWFLVSLAMVGFFATLGLTQYSSTAMNQPNSVIPAVLGADDDWTNLFQPVVKIQHSKYSPYSSWYNYGGYSNDYYSPYHSYDYWSERYRRQSYRFFYPPHVHHSFTLNSPYYSYYPMAALPYSPYYYDQYQQYMQPEQQPQVPQKTQEQIEKEMRMEVTRQIDNISQAFVLGDYERAIVRAQEALKQMPDNTNLRFICAQTLFAGGRYQNAAITVRSTLERMAQTGQQDVFYPMSLYPDQTTLNQQIDKLTAAVNVAPKNASLKLLLGYQLLGVGRVDEGVNYLQKASQDTVNEKAALYLVKVSSKIYRNLEPGTAAKKAETLNEPGAAAEKPAVAEPKY